MWSCGQTPQLSGDGTGQCFPSASTVVICGDQEELGTSETASVCWTPFQFLTSSSPHTLPLPSFTQSPWPLPEAPRLLWLWVWSHQLSPHSSALPSEASSSLSRLRCKHLCSASAWPSCSPPSPCAVFVLRFWSVSPFLALPEALSRSYSRSSF